MYSIEIKRSAAKEIEDLPLDARRRVIERIGALAKEPRPHGCEKLAGGERYRIRQGDYRIVYSVEDDVLVVWVVKVGHRRDVYRRYQSASRMNAAQGATTSRTASRLINVITTS